MLFKREVDVLCTKTMKGLWGRVYFVEGKIYKGIKEYWGLECINELGEPHTIKISWSKKFSRRYFRTLRFSSNKKKFKIKEEDKELLDSSMVLLSLMGCKVEEDFHRTFRYKNSLIYTIKSSSLIKTAYFYLQFDNKANIKKIKITMHDGYVGWFSDLQDAIDFITIFEF